jgi:hypothetical protein
MIVRTGFIEGPVASSVNADGGVHEFTTNVGATSKL